jgi:hypothetical protein
VLTSVRQGGSYQRVGDALISIRRGHLGVLQVDGIVADQRIHQLRLSTRNRKDEAGMLDIMPDIHRLTPNANTVRERYSFPGRRMVDGKVGWFGESGKCCVSSTNPDLKPYT